MSMHTRNPSGYTEDVTVLALFGSLGSWIASTVADPNLTTTIIIASGIAGQVATSWIRNRLGTSRFGSILGEKPSKGMMVGLILFCVLTFPAIASAKDCNFEKGFDAKVMRFAWPPAIGVNALGFLDTEFGWGGAFSVCANASANLIGGACLIPGVSERIAFLCPQRNVPGADGRPVPPDNP